MISYSGPWWERPWRPPDPSWAHSRQSLERWRSLRREARWWGESADKVKIQKQFFSPSPLAPELAIELWSKTFPRPHLGRFYFLVRLLGRSPISLVSGSQGLHEASRRGDLHKLPPGTNSHFTDQHRTKICRAAVARELLSLDREATWNMLWTSWMGPSLVGGGSGFMRKARAGAGRGPGPGENYGFY